MQAPHAQLPQGPLQQSPLRPGQHWRTPQDAFFAARAWVPWLLAGAVLLTATGLGSSLLQPPVLPRHGSAYPIIYIHVPATWVALLLCLLFAGSSVAGLLSSSRLAPMMAEAVAPSGALFALLALWTGSLWGRPLTGQWWEWDTRRIADLGLLSVFVATMIVRELTDDTRRADHVAAVMALFGTMAVLAALSSVALMPQVSGRYDPLVAGSGARLLATLAAVTAGFALYAGAAVLLRLRCVILERDRTAGWVAAAHGPIR